MKNGFGTISWVLGAILLALILVPLIGLIGASSWQTLKETLVDEEVLRSIKLTLSSAFLATILCAFAGIPLAYQLARKEFPGKAFLMALIDLPIIIPHSSAGIALLTVVGRKSIFGFLNEGKGLMGTSAGIALAMAFVSVPFLVNSARDGFQGVPERLEKAARTLGASPMRVFFTISFPMAWRSIFSGMIMMWARGISEFGAVVIIAYHPMVTPVLVYEKFNDYGLSYARSVAVVLVLICVSIFVTLRIVAGGKGPSSGGQNA